MKEMYLENIMKKVREELKLNNSMLSLQVAETGDRITVDGLEYFDSIKSVSVMSHNTIIAVYDIDNKKLKYYPYTNNIVIVKDLIDFLNNYNGYEKYTMTKKAENKMMLFNSKKDDIDPECVLSDYEIADILNIA